MPTNRLAHGCIEELLSSLTYKLKPYSHSPTTFDITLRFGPIAVVGCLYNLNNTQWTHDLVMSQGTYTKITEKINF